MIADAGRLSAPVMTGASSPPLCSDTMTPTSTVAAGSNWSPLHQPLKPGTSAAARAVAPQSSAAVSSRSLGGRVVLYRVSYEPRLGQVAVMGHVVMRDLTVRPFHRCRDSRCCIACCVSCDVLSPKWSPARCRVRRLHQSARRLSARAGRRQSRVRRPVAADAVTPEDAVWARISAAASTSDRGQRHRDRIRGRPPGRRARALRDGAPGARTPGARCEHGGGSGRPVRPWRAAGRWRPAGGSCRVLIDDRREHCADGHLLADVDQQGVDASVFEALGVDVGLVGLDHRDDAAAKTHDVAGRHSPLNHGAGVHVGAERRHAELTYCSAPRPGLRRRSCRPGGARPLRGAARTALALRRAQDAPDGRVELQNANSMMRALISAARLPLRHPSSMTTAR